MKGQKSRDVCRLKERKGLAVRGLTIRSRSVTNVEHQVVRVVPPNLGHLHGREQREP